MKKEESLSEALGRAAFYIFLIIIVLPAALGFIAGIILGLLFAKRQKYGYKKTVLITLFTTTVLTVVFPQVSIAVNTWHKTYENNRFHELERTYREQLLSGFLITDLERNGETLLLTFQVPYDSSYRIIVWEFQGGQNTIVFNKPGVQLSKGTNTIHFDTNPQLHDGRQAMDFVVKIENRDRSRALRNTRRYIGVTNPGSIEKIESVIYYSPSLAARNNECPVFNYLNWSTCVQHNLLHVFPNSNAI